MRPQTPCRERSCHSEWSQEWGKTRIHAGYYSGVWGQATSCPPQPHPHACGDIHWQEGTQTESLVLKSVVLSGQKQPSEKEPAS